MLLRITKTVAKDLLVHVFLGVDGSAFNGLGLFPGEVLGVDVGERIANVGEVDELFLEGLNSGLNIIETKELIIGFVESGNQVILN